MSGLHFLVRYLKREGGVPSAKDFDDAGRCLTEGGGSVIGERPWGSHKISSALHEDFKIVGVVLRDGRKKGRFLETRGLGCITEKVIHTYKSTP